MWPASASTLAAVDEELLVPKFEACAVDLRDGPVLQLQVHGGLADVECSLAGAFAVAGVDRGHERVARERVERPAHLGLEQWRHRAGRLMGRPRGPHRVEGGRRRVPVAGGGGFEDVVRAARDGRELDRHAAGERVGGHCDREGFEIPADARAELAVAGSEGLVLVEALDEVVLLPDDRALHRAARTGHGLPGGLHDDLLEHEAGDVLGAERDAELGIGGHDHAWRAVLPGHPRAVGVGDDAVLEVEHVLAEVPHGTVVGLAVPIERDLVDATVQVRDELRDERLDLLALPFDGLRPGKERGLDPQRATLVVAEKDGGMQVADREQRVVDRGRVREGGRLRSTRSLLGAVGFGLWVRRCGDATGHADRPRATDEHCCHRDTNKLCQHLTTFSRRGCREPCEDGERPHTRF